MWLDTISACECDHMGQNVGLWEAGLSYHDILTCIWRICCYDSDAFVEPVDKRGLYAEMSGYCTM